MRRQLPALLAALVVASLAGVAQTGEISSEADYDAAMKEIRTTFQALNSDMEARDGEAVMAGTRTLTARFGRVQAFWEANGVDAAAGIATQAAEAATAIRTAVETQAFQDIAPARDTLQGTCQSCHSEYREPVDGGGFRIKPGVL